jgi:brefeldin A-resistance guanine nucleotide exchange factor 1
MSSSGYLVPPSEDAAQEKLWVETWKRIDRFLPDLRKELDLEKGLSKSEPETTKIEADAVKSEPEGGKKEEVAPLVEPLS